MHLPAPVYNAVPALYFIMGIATWYFAVEAVMLEKGLGLAAFLSVSALLLIGFGFHIKRLRRRTRAVGQTQN
jgi:hypothetical protein